MKRIGALSGPLCGALLFTAAWMLAQSSGGMKLTAAVANVSGAPDTARFEILRWSTDAERDRLQAAWELRPAAAGGPGGGKGAGKAAGKAAAGKGKGAPAAEPVKLTPEASLATALQDVPTVGYLWTSETAGYALRYAGQTTAADGGQRIVLITQRRLGAMNQRWTSSTGQPAADEFSVIELRLNAQGQGEGKASVAGKLALDAAVKMVTLADYGAVPVNFEKVSIAKGK